MDVELESIAQVRMHLAVFAGDLGINFLLLLPVRGPVDLGQRRPNNFCLESSLIRSFLTEKADFSLYLLVNTYNECYFTFIRYV